MSDKRLGDVERAAILARFVDLFEGRVWRSKPPQGFELPRYEGLVLKPYLIFGSSDPVPSSLESEHALDPRMPAYILHTSTRVIGGDPDEVQEGNRVVVGLLDGWSPSPGSTTVLRAYAENISENWEHRHLPNVWVDTVSWVCTLNTTRTEPDVSPRGAALSLHSNTVPGKRPRTVRLSR